MLAVFVLTSSLWPLWPEQIMASSLTFSAQPTLAEVIRSRTLAQPLLPMGGTEPSPAEISALAQALATFSKVPANSEDASALESFLAAYPQSAFRVSLLTNLGMMYRQHGYWSNALSAWQQAWQAGKTETDPAKRLVVDQALSHLAELTARIGRIDDLSALFQDAGSRAVRGPSAERYSMAKESLFLMQTKPTKSYRCGPFAVGQVLQALHPERSLGKEMHDSVSTDHGTSLTMVRDFAQKLGLNYQLAFRNPGAAVLVPSVVNWKVGHFAALTQEVSDRYLVKDPTFTDNFGVSTRALDQEASGYFLVRSGSLPPGWRTVTDQEGQKVWGRGAVPNNTAGTPPCTSPSSCSGMAVHNVDLARVNLFLDDTPLFYTPPRGPAVELMATYSQRDIPPVSLTNFPNLGVAWNLNWVAFIVDNPNNTTSYGPGGGTLNYTNYNSSTQAFAPQVQTQAILQRVTTTAPAYEYVRTFPDGSRQVFNFTRVFNGTTYFFMTESDDPAGNSIQYNYDASTGRLTSVTDAMGLITAITYNETDSSQPDYFTINSVKDPYNRTANFSYNALGQLLTITDMASLTSSFTYNANDAIIKLTTPYGATIFDEQDQGETRSMLITDPEGGKEQIMYVGEGVTPPDPNPTLPSGTGMTFNSAWQEENTYYWNKQAYAVGAGDYTKAHLYHWLLLPGSAQMSDVPSDEKPALESRIFYNYAGQSSSNIIGASNQPTAVARVLDGGATQLAQYAYNPQGRMTEAVTPGNSTTPARTTTYWYAQNGIDLTAVYQWNPHGSTTDPSGAQADLLRSMTYNAQHEVLSATDAAQEPSSYVYNAYGQLLSFTNAKQQTTTYTYDRDQEGGNGVTDGFLLTVTRPAPNATTAFTYGSYGLVASVEDSDGYTVGINYDLLNRITKRSYPDHSYEEIDYDRLDPQWQRDRLGRWTQMLYDAERHLTVVIDPLSRITQYDWCSCGSLEAITDANGNKTTWMRDAESRVTAKVYADGRVWGTTYEPSTSRVSYTNDPKGQYTIYGYNVDNSVASVKYASDASGTALSPPTPGVTYAYDPAYPRLLTMQDGIGTTTYTYNPVPAPSTPTRGGGRLASEAGPFANSTITYGYDELGRLAGQSVSDYTVPTSFGYDTLGRLNQVTNQLDTFTYGYVDNTNRLNSVTSKYGPATQYAYYGGNNDPRLQNPHQLHREWHGFAVRLHLQRRGRHPGLDAEQLRGRRRAAVRLRLRRGQRTDLGHVAGHGDGQHPERAGVCLRRGGQSGQRAERGQRDDRDAQQPEPAHRDQRRRPGALCGHGERECDAQRQPSGQRERGWERGDGAGGRELRGLGAGQRHGHDERAHRGHGQQQCLDHQARERTGQCGGGAKLRLRSRRQPDGGGTERRQPHGDLRLGCPQPAGEHHAGQQRDDVRLRWTKPAGAREPQRHGGASLDLDRPDPSRGTQRGQLSDQAVLCPGRADRRTELLLHA